jgi:hypothetical protein
MVRPFFVLSRIVSLVDATALFADALSLREPAARYDFVQTVVLYITHSDWRGRV